GDRPGDGDRGARGGGRAGSLRGAAGVGRGHPMTVLAERVAAPARPRTRRPGYAAGLTATGAAGLAARLVLLGRQPISRDEAFTAVVARRSWVGMLDVVRHDSAPPLSYVLAHVATAFSTSPSLLRLPSALAGAAAIPVAAA